MSGLMKKKKKKKKRVSWCFEPSQLHRVISRLMKKKKKEKPVSHLGLYQR